MVVVVGSYDWGTVTDIPGFIGCLVTMKHDTISTAYKMVDFWY